MTSERPKRRSPRPTSRSPTRDDHDADVVAGGVLRADDAQGLAVAALTSVTPDRLAVSCSMGPPARWNVTTPPRPRRPGRSVAISSRISVHEMVDRRGGADLAPRPPAAPTTFSRIPERSGVPSGVRGAGAAMSTLPSRSLGTPAVGYDGHCAVTGMVSSKTKRRSPVFRQLCIGISPGRNAECIRGGSQEKGRENGKDTVRARRPTWPCQR
jgi:hypothetical protein